MKEDRILEIFYIQDYELFLMLQDYRTAVCPFIDVVDYNNMEYRAQDEGARGAFDWQLYYKRQVPCVRQEPLLCPSRM
jgi:hypothetical protein